MRIARRTPLFQFYGEILKIRGNYTIIMNSIEKEKNTHIRMICRSGKLPEYKTEGASGMDLEAYIEEPITLAPMERKLIPTGLFVEIPQGMEGQLRARSGLAIRKGIGLVNSIGTIDSDYRGEIKVPLINFGQEPFEIHNGDRIAQFVIASYEKVVPVKVDSIEETTRGEGGFGSTGK